MNIDLAKRWTRRWEGVRSKVYLDTKGIPTIGVGCNLTTKIAKDLIESLALDYEGIIAGRVLLGDAAINMLFEAQMSLSIHFARVLVPNFDEFPDPPKIVVNDLSFNMGPVTLAKFHDTLAAIKAQDWTAAAACLTRSAWYHQVGKRGVANVAVLGNTATIESFL